MVEAMNRRLFVLAVLTLTGCATAGPWEGPDPAAAAMGELEPLYLADAGRDAITIRVSSNGCTQKGDFAFFVERKGDAVTVAFGRKRIDTCKSFAMGSTELSFSWDELGLKPGTTVFLLNPLERWTGPGS